MRKLLIPALYSFLILVFIEIGFTTYLNLFASREVFTQYASYKSLSKRYGEAKLIRHRYLGYGLNPNYKSTNDRHNKHGFRGKELSGDSSLFRIVCLGGSTTYGTGVDDYRQSYPYLLEGHLKELGLNQVEVINAGVPGYGSLEILLNYQLLISELKPDLIIIYSGINDIMARMVWPPEAFHADNSGYRSTQLFNQSIPIWEYSSVIRSILIKMQLTDSHSKLTQIDPVAETSIANDFFQQLREDVPLSGILKTPGIDSVLTSNSSRFFDENITKLIQQARSEGTQTILTSFLFDPTFYQNKNNNLPQVLASAIQQSNQVLEKISIDEGALFLDLVTVLKERRGLHKSDGIHFTESGNEFRASALAKYIITMSIGND